MTDHELTIGLDDLLQVDWNKLKIFYHIAQSKSLLEAASLLNYDQSTLSRMIQSLEGSLGYPILIRKRSRDGVELTEQGKILLRASQNIFAELTLAGSQIDEQYNVPRGLLKISPVLGVFPFLSPHIPKFLELNKEMRLVFYETDHAPQLERFETDVLIHPFIPNRPEMVQDLLIQHKLSIYASPDYLEKHGTPMSVSDLDHHQLIASSLPRYTQHLVRSNWILDIDKLPGQSRIPYIETNSMVSRMEMAKLGLGIASLPDNMPGLTEANLVQILPDVEGPELQMFYSYSELVKHSKRVLGFRDYLLDIFQRNRGV